jgi:exodeoxyribonuclease VII large subunit
VPTLPRRIGVVTSTSGAAIRDFLRVLHSRFANLPVLIAPARVQGEGAASELVAGIERLVRFSKNAPPGEQLDVIVLTRGGGSIEDLWAFNEEIVARALAACPIPTVSAVGHEVDFTIADFVADLRCPTPTAAAERLAPEKPKELALLDVSKARLAQAVRALVSVESEQVLRLRQRLGDPRRELAAHRLRLEGHASSLQTSALDLLARGREHLSHAKDELYRHHPSEQLQRHERLLRAHREALGQELRQRLVERREQLSALKERLLACSPATEVLKQRGRLLALQKDLGSAQEQLLSGLRLHFEAQASRLDALSPLQVMRRGYAIAFREGRVLRSTEQVRVGDAISVRLSDQGRVQAQVTAVEPPNKTSS